MPSMLINGVAVRQPHGSGRRAMALGGMIRGELETEQRAPVWLRQVNNNECSGESRGSSEQIEPGETCFDNMPLDLLDLSRRRHCHLEMHRQLLCRPLISAAPRSGPDTSSTRRVECGGLSTSRQLDMQAVHEVPNFPCSPSIPSIWIPVARRALSGS